MKKERKSFYILLASLLLLIIITISLAMLLERGGTLNRQNLIENLSNQDLPIEESMQKVHGYIAENDLNNAELLLQALVKKYPKESEPRLLLGQVYYRQKIYVRAENTFKQHVLFHPQMAAGYFNLCVSQIKLNKFDEAKDNIFKAIRLSPENIDFLLQAAELHAILKENQPAVNFLYSAFEQGADPRQIQQYPHLMKLQDSPDISQYYQQINKNPTDD